MDSELMKEKDKLFKKLSELNDKDKSEFLAFAKDWLDADVNNNKNYKPLRYLTDMLQSYFKEEK